MSAAADETTDVARAALFRKLRHELTQQPPILVTVIELVTLFRAGLKKFVPSRLDLHGQIDDDLDLAVDVGVDEAPRVSTNLLKWIRKFQAPADDEFTNALESRLRDAALQRAQQNEAQIASGEKQDVYATAFCKFLEEFYTHSEIVYKNAWEARARIARGESAIAPEHRPQGHNGIPKTLRSGRR